MEEVQKSGGCERCCKSKSWEQQFYWKHFRSTHFFLFLPHDFHHHLVLPAKFVKNTTANLPQKVSLIAPSGFVWDVNMINKTDSIEFAGDGWKQFIKALGLKKNDLLVFKYTKNSSFEVLIFDPNNFCEKEASYFVKQRRHHENEKNRKVTEAVEIGDNDDDDEVDDEHNRSVTAEGGDNDDDHHNDSELVLTKKWMHAVHEGIGRRKRRRKGGLSCHSRAKSRPKKKLGSEVQFENEAGENGATKEQTRVLEREQNTPENGGSVLDTAQTLKLTKRTRMRTTSSRTPVFGSENELVHDVTEEEEEDNRASKEPSHGSQREHNSLADRLNVLETADSHKSTEKNGSPKKLLMAQSDSAEKKYSCNYKSNRRKVTETEKDDAYQSACQVLTEMGFLSVMTHSAVYTRFYLSIPVAWIKGHLHFENHELVLRMGEKTWLIMFYDNGKGGGGIAGSGWKKFAVDNFLEEFDVCHFEPSTENEDDTKTILDVEIFRVIPVVVPPTPTPRSKLA